MSTKISSEIRARFIEALGERVKFDERLAPYVAYGIGGPADILALPNSEQDLQTISAIAKDLQLPVKVLGSGTNLLVRDEGIRGISVVFRGAFQEIEDWGHSPSGGFLVRAGGGVLKPTLLDWAASRSLTGLEFSSGVPGTVGGGIFMNAGTKYGCYGDILREIRLFDFTDGAKQLSTTAGQFGYREQSLVKDSIVLWTVFELQKGEELAIRAEIERIIAERAAKQPLDFPSCGSTFKNPEGYSAGRLIEKAGLKGLRVGGAEISEKHANFILNKGGATAKDILSLIKTVQDRVKAQFSVELETEVIVVGG